MGYTTDFQLAGVCIRLVRNRPLTVDPAFSDYQQAGPAGDPLICRMEENAALPELRDTAVLLYQDETNRIYRSQTELLRCYYRPYYGAPHPKLRQPDALCRWDGDRLHLLYRAEAEDFFSRASGCFEALGPERLLLRRGRVVMRGHLVNYRGQALVLLAATQEEGRAVAEAWVRRRGAVLLHPCRAALALEEDQPMAYALPVPRWDGVAWNRALPLAGLVLLEQGSEAGLWRERLSFSLPFLLGATVLDTWDPEATELARPLLSQVLSRTPVYHQVWTPEDPTAPLEQVL